jgi:hypothetical protein
MAKVPIVSTGFAQLHLAGKSNMARYIHNYCSNISRHLPKKIIRIRIRIINNINDLVLRFYYDQYSRYTNNKVTA